MLIGTFYTSGPSRTLRRSWCFIDKAYKKKHGRKAMFAAGGLLRHSVLGMPLGQEPSSPQSDWPRH